MNGYTHFLLYAFFVPANGKATIIFWAEHCRFAHNFEIGTNKLLINPLRALLHTFMIEFYRQTITF